MSYHFTFNGMLKSKGQIIFSSLHLLRSIQLFASPWITAHQASLSMPNSWSLLTLMSHRWYHPTISSSVIPFSTCLQSFPVSGSFPMSQFFTWGGQSIGASPPASVLPINIQDWFPLELTGLISLQSKGFSRSLLQPQFKSINSSLLSFLHSPTLTSIHDYWKNQSFDYTDFCQQSDVSAS